MLGPHLARFLPGLILIATVLSVASFVSPGWEKRASQLAANPNCRDAVEHTLVNVGEKEDLRRNGYQIRGEFPSDTLVYPYGTPFAVLNLDGEMVVAFDDKVIHPTAKVVRQYFDFGPVDSLQREEAESFFTQLGACLRSDASPSTTGYFTEFGYGWLCASDDFFSVEQSQTGLSCPDADNEAAASTLGTLQDIYALPDGRLRCVLSLEVAGTPIAESSDDQVSAMIWVIGKYDNEYLADAVVGDILW